MNGFYINDHEEGVSYWDVEKETQKDIVLVLKSKPFLDSKGNEYFRKRLFSKSDIGKIIFEHVDDVKKQKKSSVEMGDGMNKKDIIETLVSIVVSVLTSLVVLVIFSLFN